jgi:hypothetical protein
MPGREIVYGLTDLDTREDIDPNIAHRGIVSFGGTEHSFMYFRLVLDYTHVDQQAKYCNYSIVLCNVLPFISSYHRPLKERNHSCHSH